MPIQLKLGQKLTLFSISSWMAHTVKQEVPVTKLLEPTPESSYVNGPTIAHRCGHMKPRGKRKEFYLDIPVESLVFDGWDLPVIPDSQIDREMVGGLVSREFSGNACFNLGGPSPEMVRDYIENRNLNGPTSDRIKAMCIYKTANSDNDELLYPDIEISHAVINRMKEKLYASAA